MGLHHLPQVPPSLESLQHKLDGALAAASAHDLLAARPEGEAVLQDPLVREQHARIQVAHGNVVDGRLLACWAALAAPLEAAVPEVPEVPEVPAQWVALLASVEEAALLLRCCELLRSMTPLVR